MVCIIDNIKNIKRIILLICFIICYSKMFSQNIFGDYVASDFERFHANKFRIWYTKIDTITNRHEKELLTTVSFNSKTKLIKIKHKKEHAFYCITDSFGELINVNKYGQIDTNLCSREFLTPRVYYKDDYKVIKYAEIFRFYNKENLVVRCVSDTTNLNLFSLSEFYLSYENRNLAKLITLRYELGVNKFDISPKNRLLKERETTIYENEGEFIVSEYFDDKKEIVKTFRTTVNKASRRLITKVYYNKKLISITEIIW